MGIIKSQGIRNSFINYFGAAFGILSTLYIYPLDQDAHGLAMFLISTATFIYPLASGGIISTIVRFFPYFRSNKDKHNGFLTFIFIAALFNFILSLIIIFFFKEFILSTLVQLGINVELFLKFKHPIGILCFLVILNNLFYYYTSNFQKIVVPSIFYNLIPKASIPIFVFLSSTGFINLSEFLYGLIGYHLLITVCLIGYLRFIGEWRWKTPSYQIFNKVQLKKIGCFSLYGILGSLGSMLAFRLDGIMIPTLLDIKDNSTYFISMFIASSIEIPARSILPIVSPIIASSYVKKDFDNISSVYKKSSLILFIIGLMIFIAIWVSIDLIFMLTSKPDILRPGKYVVLFIGIAKIIDMATSINSQIIAQSPYYSYNLYIVIVLGVVNFGLNSLLIPTMGITGAALATLISLTVFNLCKLIFIWAKFKIQPFSIRFIGVLCIGILSYSIAAVIPEISNSPLLNIFIKCSIVAILFIPTILFFKISEDLNILFHQFLTEIRKKISKM